MSGGAVDPQQVEAAAEAICGATSSGQLFPWDELSEKDRDAWRCMARAAIEALQLTEETNAHYGDRYSDDIPATRRRLVGPWRTAEESGE